MAEIDVDGVHVYRSDPSGTPRGGLVLIHEIWGLVPHITDVADRFAAEGYVVVAPDLLSDIGMTPHLGEELQALLTDPDETRRASAQPRLREALAPMRVPGFAASAVAALRKSVDVLVSEPGYSGRVAVVGFCFGGTYSFALAAADDRVRAAVPFYGSAPEPDQIAKIGCPILAFYGAEDAALMKTLPGVRVEMAAAGVDFADQVYADAPHAFFNDTSSRYRPDAAADVWRRALAFLDHNLG